MSKDGGRHEEHSRRRAGQGPGGLAFGSAKRKNTESKLGSGANAEVVGGGTINSFKNERRERKVKRIHDILRLHEYKPVTEPSSLQAVNAAFSRSAMYAGLFRKPQTRVSREQA